jgi:hypothetical protein
MPGMRAKGEQVKVLACRPGPVASIHKRQSVGGRRPRVARLPSAGEAAFRRRRARPGPTLVCTVCGSRRAAQ